MNYYYVDANNQAQGPLTVEQLRAMLTLNQLTGDSLVCAEGGESWTPLRALLLVTNIPPVVNVPAANKSSSHTGLTTVIIALVVLVGLTLPFHYVPSHGTVFAKSTLTFSHTFVTEDDIDELIERFNKASFAEKMALQQDPFVQKLREKKIIGDKK